MADLCYKISKDLCDRVNPEAEVVLRILEHGPGNSIEGVRCSWRTLDYRCSNTSNSSNGNCRYNCPGF